MFRELEDRRLIDIQNRSISTLQYVLQSISDENCVIKSEFNSLLEELDDMEWEKEDDRLLETTDFAPMV